ncbi:MAG TPA: HlyC/CorC family transporter [Anaerolineae bacterium]|nr:HlyC/CorC family transporter [Anaerolineae bacterium]HIP73337.1 HlyC/CorC family transporter [Anaerolineae bacterium]
MSPIVMEIFIILLLIMVNGLFAMSEIAIVLARKPRLQQWADKGDKKAQLALTLAKDPEDFLSTVQTGITMIGILAGVFGGATLAEDLAVLLETGGIPARYSETISMAVVVAIITYLSLVIGELVPKNLALQNTERRATAVAPFMYRLSRIAYPFIWLLTTSTQIMMRLLGVKQSEETPVTDEEIEIMMQEGAQAGAFEPEEPEMVRRIFRLSDRDVSSLMTPRREIAWLDPTDTPDSIHQKITATGHSRFPVAENDLDHVIGYIEIKELLKQSSFNPGFDPCSILHPPLYVPETISALELLERFKKEHEHMALVFDEYGGLQGLVTSTDLLESIVGDIDLPRVPLIIRRKDNSWLVDGMLPIVDLLETLELESLPNVKGRYRTVGGFMMAALEKVPTEGEQYDWEGFRFEVVDMDDYRVDKVLVSALVTNERGDTEI